MCFYITLAVPESSVDPLQQLRPKFPFRFVISTNRSVVAALPLGSEPVKTKAALPIGIGPLVAA